MLLTDLKRGSAPRLWAEYCQRSGTIEEYNDQSERAYHLEVMRTGNFAGLNAVQSLVGLCWNLTRWATEDLALPPEFSIATMEEFVDWERDGLYVLERGEGECAV